MDRLRSPAVTGSNGGRRPRREPLYTQTEPELYQYLKDNYPEWLCACGDVLGRPYRLSPCGHFVCEHCAGGSRMCPVCQTPYSARELVDPDRDEEAIALGIPRPDTQLDCPYCPEAPGKAGCLWKGSFVKLVAHLQDECQWAYTHCPYADRGCEELITRRMVKSHARECMYRPVQCPFCGKTFAQCDYTGGHADECRQLHYKCQHCGEMILKTERGQHLQVCQLVAVSCPIPGCDDVVLRKDISSHVGCEGEIHSKHTKQLGIACLYGVSNLSKTLTEIQTLRRGIALRRQHLDQLTVSIENTKIRAEELAKSSKRTESDQEDETDTSDESEECISTCEENEMKPENPDEIHVLMDRYSQLRNDCIAALSDRISLLHELERTENIF